MLLLPLVCARKLFVADSAECCKYCTASTNFYLLKRRCLCEYVCVCVVWRCLQKITRARTHTYKHLQITNHSGRVSSVGGRRLELAATASTQAAGAIIARFSRACAYYHKTHTIPSRSSRRYVETHTRAIKYTSVCERAKMLLSSRHTPRTTHWVDPVDGDGDGDWRRRRLLTMPNRSGPIVSRVHAYYTPMNTRQQICGWRLCRLPIVIAPFSDCERTDR